MYKSATYTQKVTDNRFFAFFRNIITPHDEIQLMKLQMVLFIYIYITSVTFRYKAMIIKELGGNRCGNRW